MHLVQRDCVVCPPHIPDHCDPACNSNEQCSVVFQTCDTCSTAVCIPTGGGDSSSQSNGGSNVGAIVGGVVAAVVLVLLAIGFRWYRGRRAMAVAAAHKRATFEPKPDVVASADTVLNRPDPTINIIIEKPESAMHSPNSQHTFEDGSPIRFEPPENPFSDHASIATASDRATNVIPIGLITPSSASLASRTTELTRTAVSANGNASIASSAPSGFTLHPPSESPRELTFSQTQQQQQPTTPMRPQRGPDIDMRLDLSRPLSTASQGGVLLPPNAPYAASARTGMTGVSSRSSILSTSSSFLNEAPQIVTPQQANFRQVLGVQRAAVVQLGSSSLSPTASLKSRGSSSTVRKPGSNPFNDGEDMEKDGDVGMYNNDRPMSSMSNAESVANIASAQRVQLIKPLNLTTPGSRPGEGRPPLSPSQLSPSAYSPTITGRSPGGPNSNVSSPTATLHAVDFRTAGQLTPPSQGVPRSFDDMVEQGPPSFDDRERPDSLQSFAMTNRTSTADSILESFPFVPPSPISMHHTQPHQSRMQQQQQTFLQTQNQGRILNARGPSSLRIESTQGFAGGSNNRPGRLTLGFSTVSSASSGLGAFPFRFDGDVTQRNNSSTIGPSRLGHPQEEEEDEYYGHGGAALGESTIGHGDDRASLDTLQLSRDLSEFPLPMGNPGFGPPRR